MNSKKPIQEKKRKAIMREATRLFVKNGIHRTSMQAIAKKSRIATGSIYNYFANKDDLVNEIFRITRQEIIDFNQAGYCETASVKTRFYYLIRRLIDFQKKYPEKFQFMSLYAYSPAIMCNIQQDDHNQSPLANVIRQGKAEQLIIDLPVEDIFYHVYGGVSSQLRWKLFNQETITETDIESMIGMAWHSIKC